MCYRIPFGLPTCQGQSYILPTETSHFLFHFFWNVNLKRHHCWYAGEFPRRSFISPRKMSPSAKWRSKFEMTGSSCLESNNHSTGQSLLYEPYQIMVWDYHIMVEFNVSREQRQRDASERHASLAGNDTWEERKCAGESGRSKLQCPLLRSKKKSLTSHPCRKIYLVITTVRFPFSYTDIR